MPLSMLREGWQSAALEEEQPGGLAPGGVPRQAHSTCGCDFYFSCLTKSGNKEWEGGKSKVSDGTEEKEESKSTVGKTVRVSEAHTCSKRSDSCMARGSCLL